MNRKIFGLVLCTLLLSGCGQSKAPTSTPSLQEEPLVINESVTTSESTTTLNGVVTSTDTTTVVTSTEPEVARISFDVVWQKPVEVKRSELGIPEEKSETLSEEPPMSTGLYDAYYKVGKTTYQNKNADVYLAAVYPANEPAFYPNYNFYIKQGGRTELVERFKQPYEIDSKGIGTIPSLYPPKEISGDNQYKKFKYVMSVDKQMIQGSLRPIFMHSTLGQFYTTTSTNGFYVQTGPLYAVYSFVPYFISENSGIPQISWNDKSQTKEAYSFTQSSGCGSSNYLNIISPKDINIAKDLVRAGTTAAGESIYLFKDKNNAILQKMYDQTYFPDGQKMSYEAFVSAKPVFFWVDPFGDLVQFQNPQYGLQAECGKPVIYLYPTSTADVTVMLQPQGGFTFSEPAYVTDWRVRATPNGHLTDLRTNKEYPYLFWEGRGGFYEQPKQGWVVKQKELKTFIPNKLKQLGLNKNEIADFVEFWMPRMQEKPYYFITFMGNKTMDTIAPLTVTPKPDTVIRVLMDYTPLDKPIKVKGYAIKTPKRTGFTVTEWGGVLRK